MKCVVCGCTDDLACMDDIVGPCRWAKTLTRDRGICSACPAPVPTRKLTLKQRTARKELADKVRRIEQHRRMQMNNARAAQEGYELAVEDLRSFERKLAKAVA